MTKKKYELTDKAGDFVAGQRRPEGSTIELTDEQAEHPLMLGEIILVPAPVKAAPVKAIKD